MTDWQVITGDCLEVMREMDAGSVDAVITDPPYPDYHIDKYRQTAIDFLDELPCRQLIFWSAKIDFPLDYTAIHIWRKTGTGCASMYERIFERRGHRNYRVFSGNPISNDFNARVSRDEFWGHPSQKPVTVIRELIELCTKPGDLIFDPFCGSGTTGVACIQTGRRFVGIEIDPGYADIARARCAKAAEQARQLKLL